MSAVQRLKQWARQGRGPLARRVWRLAKAGRGGSLPPIPILHGGLWTLVSAGGRWRAALLRRLYWTPLFQARLTAMAPGLYLGGAMPRIAGGLRVHLGRDCRLAAGIVLSAGTNGLLEIGHSCHIQAQTVLNVGTRIALGDNVRLGEGVLLAGHPGYPITGTRAAPLGLAGDIVLEDDVWLRGGVSVMPGIRIGRGAIVEAGSVVTKDLPPFVLAGGVPARVLKELPHAP